MRKAVNVISTVVLVLVCVFAFLLVGVRIFGLQPYTVLSGSMEPEYHVGSLIYVRDAELSELLVDVPITYRMSNGVVVTHRIIEVLVNENNPTDVSFRTKGDANDDPDGEPVPFSRVIGRPVFTVPLIGYVCFFIQNPPGIYITVAIVLLVLLLTFIPDLFVALLQDSPSGAGKEASEHYRDERKKIESQIAEIKSQIEKGNREKSATSEPTTKEDGADTDKPTNDS